MIPNKISSLLDNPFSFSIKPIDFKMNPFSPNQLIQIIVSYPILYHFFSNLKTKETFSKTKTLFYQPYQVKASKCYFNSVLNYPISLILQINFCYCCYGLIFILTFDYNAVGCWCFNVNSSF